MAQVGGPLSDERFAPPGTPADWVHYRRWIKNRISLNASGGGVLFRGRCMLRGYSIGFLTGAASASVTFYDGVDGNGEIIAIVIGTQPFSSAQGFGDGLPIERGLFLVVSSQAIYGGIYIDQPMAGDDPALK